MRTEKQFAIEELKERIEGATAVIFTDYAGAGAEQMVILRHALHERNGRYMVVKNRLFTLAAKAAGFESELPGFAGQVGVAFTDEESSVPVLKALVDFRKEHEAVALLGGFVGGKPYTADELKELSKLPPKPLMRAQVLGTFQVVPRGFVSVLAGRLRSVLHLINAYIEKQGGAPAEADKGSDDQESADAGASGAEPKSEPPAGEAGDE